MVSAIRHPSPLALFIVRRLAVMVLVLLVLLLLLFVLQHVSNVDPAAAYIGAKAPPAEVAAARHRLGLDDPLIVQYWHYLIHALNFNLGISLRTRHTVASDIATFLPATIKLVVAAFAIATVLGSLFALSGALHWPGGLAFRGGLLVLASAPSFLLGLVGIVVFYSRLGWLPASGDSGLSSLILPALCLAMLPALAIGRVLRSSVEQTLRAPHVRTARAKGIRESAVFARHVLRNAIGPALSMSGLQLGGMFVGVVVIEQVFSWPGIGLYLGQSIANDDFPAIAGVTLLFGAIYVVANAVVDIAQTVADPRLTM